MYIIDPVSIWSWKVKIFVTQKVRFLGKIGHKSIFCGKMMYDTGISIKESKSTDNFTLEMT